MVTNSQWNPDAMKGYIEKLNKIYAKVPEAVCTKCGKCCGPIGFTVLEEKNIEKYLEENALRVYPCVVGRTGGCIYTFDAKMRCPFHKDNGCAIYPVRPIVCRLFGVIEGGRELPCNNVVCKRKLSVQYAGKLVKQVDRLNDKFMKEEAEAII